MNQVDQTKSTVSRPMVAAIAAACLAAAVAMYFWWPDPFWYGSLFRVGIVMAILWFALPGPGRKAAWANISPWALGAIALLVILLPRMKQMIIPVLVVLALAAIFLRPRRKRGPPRAP